MGHMNIPQSLLWKLRLLRALHKLVEVINTMRGGK